MDVTEDFAVALQRLGARHALFESRHVLPELPTAMVAAAYGQLPESCLLTLSPEFTSHAFPDAFLAAAARFPRTALIRGANILAGMSRPALVHAAQAQPDTAVQYAARELAQYCPDLFDRLVLDHPLTALSHHPTLVMDRPGLLVAVFAASHEVAR